jgi:hypothetical protein
VEAPIRRAIRNTHLAAIPTISRTHTVPARMSAAHALLYIRYMRKLLGLAFVLSGCVVGGGEAPPVGDDDVPPPDPDPTDGVSGSIQADQTWTGTIDVVGQTTIEAGVTVTVMPGTTVLLKDVAALKVLGTLTAVGAKGSEIRFERADVTKPHPGSVAVTGTLTYNYVVQDGFGIFTNVGGNSTITDSKLSNAAGDFLVMAGGSLTVDHSQIGADLTGAKDSTHCQIHLGGAPTISVTRSNIEGSAYGLMFYAGTGAIFTDNNWDEIAADADPEWIDTQTNVSISGDFSGSFFAAGQPTATPNATLTLNNISTTRLTDAGVR